MKLLPRVRDSLSVFAAKEVHNSFILPTMLYCSMPVLKVSDTMSKKLDSVQNRAQKVIHELQEKNRCRLIWINNHKRMKVVMKMFKCWQDTTIPALRTYAENIDHQPDT